jgi:peptidoglycan-associated lipoprotein
MRRIIRVGAVIAAVLATAACGSFRTGDETPPGSTATIPPGTPQDFFVNVGDRVFFNDNVADLTSTSNETLDKQAAWLVRFASYTVTIEGHSDEKGDKAKNMTLGNRRAQAVRNYLLAKGVPAQRVKFVSYGKDRRVSTCNDISCWSQNRRAVTVLDGVEPAAAPAAPAPVHMTPPPRTPRG